MSDVINVKTDYGATGNGVTNDTTTIQNALNAAFGSSSSPHGYTNRHLNVPVYFPNGNYVISSGGLNLTKVVGGHIFGAGAGATRLSGQGGSVLVFNGCRDLTFERFTMSVGARSGNVSCIDLDWDGTDDGSGQIGLSHSTFRQILMATSQYGIRIAKSNHEGHNNSFEHVLGNDTIYGIVAEGTASFNNQVFGGGWSANNPASIGYWSKGGSIHVSGASTAGNTVDNQNDSGFPVNIFSGRTEGPQSVKLTSGLVNWRAVGIAGGGTASTSTITGNTTFTVGTYDGSGIFVGQTLVGAGVTPGTRILANLTLPGPGYNGSTWTITSSTNVGSSTIQVVHTLAEITGGTMTIDGPAGSSSVVVGSGGKLYVRAAQAVLTDFLTGYSGTIVQNI